MFQQDGACPHTSKATIAWLDANIKQYIPREDWPPNSQDLSLIEKWTFGALWQQPFMPTPSLGHWRNVSKKHGNQFLCQHFKILSVWCLTDWKQSLSTMEIPFHTNRERGRRHHLTLTFISPLLCNFKCGVINEYCKCCVIATTIKFYTKNFIEYYLRGDLKLLLVTVNNRLILEIEIIHDLYRVTLYFPISCILCKQFDMLQLLIKYEYLNISLWVKNW